jgi:hypothetical protein
MKNVPETGIFHWYKTTTHSHYSQQSHLAQIGTFPYTEAGKGLKQKLKKLPDMLEWGLMMTCGKVCQTYLGP